VGVVSARADLPVDRLEDALLVTDVLGAGASRHGLDGRVRVRAQALDRTLVLLVGPLAEGGGDALLEESRVPGFGDVVARLADEVTVVPDDAGAEFVRVELSARA